MKQRDDIHRPSIVIPADYEFVTMMYLGANDDAWEAFRDQCDSKFMDEHQKRTGGAFIDDTGHGTCNICNARALYVGYFYHAKTNAYLVIGHECANKMGQDVSVFKSFKKRLQLHRETMAKKAKALDFLTSKGVERAMFYFDNNGIAGREANIVRDIVSKLIRYGSISDGQVALIARLLAGESERARIAAERAAATAAALPVPAGRIAISGVVLVVKEQENGYAPQSRWSTGPAMIRKMLVQHIDGWKVWGSVPAAISDVKAGDQVSFVATVAASPDDAKFGFYSRPSKAEVIVVA